MTLPLATLLSHRSVIRLGGEGRHAFLQGLVSNDVKKADGGIHAALLTPQGKFLHDMFILEHENAFLIECEASRAEDLLRRLSAYKLRSKVTFENLANLYDVWAVRDENANALFPRRRESISAASAAQEAIAEFPDPRLSELGTRIFALKNTPPPNTTPTDFATYDQHRLSLGIADGSRDMEIEKSTLVESNFDFLDGVDWKKGCYIGQELTARMHYRGLAKKRLFPVRIDGAAPAFGAAVHFGNEEVGEMRSSSGSLGLALLKIDAVQQSLAEKMPLTNAETRLFQTIPAWMKIDATAPNR